ncbi:hypothetical protein JOF48_000597 [Arthrobacter stackebrandtii]|uniref:Uncharacterized protein n=1 Tax=Arthrobacter stackebrandtii TaxID=272161 RepID=A0ABS4YSM4_9MICC|nr:hypothetical protein [Arthrobacter stackebrandtii]MBP2411798.1 hypothetical protein [Arthrobacter stackebrandtii]
MNRNPDFNDNELIHDRGSVDGLGEIYSEMVTPDIEEMNEHADTLEQESQVEPDAL